MEVYILDESLRRVIVIDRFESLIWTERSKAWGDFELVTYSTPRNRKLLPSGIRLAINESRRVMVVETVENETDTEGRSMLKIKGRSLEYLLDDRIAMESLEGLNAIEDEPVWSISGKPGAIGRELFDHICVQGALDFNDKLPLYTPGNLFPPDTIREARTDTVMDFKPQSLYRALQEVCDIHSFGFRIYRNHDESELYFNLFTGVDRTSSQDNVNPVIFSSNLDNLEGVSELQEITNAKNVAYVYSKNGSQKVYATGVGESTKGFDRRVMLVKVDSDLIAGEALTDLLYRKGREELAKNRGVAGFDGEVSQFGSYKYGTDYDLGDLVEMRTTDNVTNLMRVTEQIFVSDAEGERSYPTLSVELYITPGTWASWDYDEIWPEATGSWEDA